MTTSGVLYRSFSTFSSSLSTVIRPCDTGEDRLLLLLLLPADTHCLGLWGVDDGFGKSVLKLDCCRPTAASILAETKAMQAAAVLGPEAKSCTTSVETDKRAGTPGKR